MGKIKKKRKNAGAGPRSRRRQWLAFLVICAVLVIISGLLVFKVLEPGDQPELPGDYTRETGLAISDGEQRVDTSGRPELSESRLKKGPVVADEVGPGQESDRPLIAIVIDDMGYNKKTCEAIIELDLNLSFAFLPYGQYTARQAYRANRLGRDVLLHFPMEATDSKFNPGLGAIAVNMQRDEIRKIFKNNLASVPYAVGINNHMGSRFTEDERVMRIFMESVQGSGLFFLDSRTTQNSVGYEVAKKMAVLTVERDIFLDNVREPRKIMMQLDKLVETARKKGTAIAIGHPYPETLQALREFRKVSGRQVKMVGIGELVH